MTKTPEQMAEEYCASPHEKDAFLAGYQAAKDQLQPQPFHAGADVYIIDANNPRPKPMPLSIAEQEKPRFEFKPLEYCGDDEVLREMFSLPTNYWMTEQELKECGLQAVVADKLADTSKVMNSPNNSNGWISVKDRLPEFTHLVSQNGDGYTDDVLMLFTDGTMEVIEFERRDGIVETGHLHDLDLVTHWMPLPTLPKEEK